MLSKRYLKPTALCSLAAALLLLPIASRAGTETAGKTVVEQTKSYISGDFGVTWTNAYLSRGVVQEDNGLILQPYLDIYIKLYEGTGFINSVTFNGGLWSSLHSEHTAATTGGLLRAWYEFDWLPGVSITFAKNWTFTPSWYDFDFISSGGRAGNLNLSLAYNDTDLLGKWALHPHFTTLKGFVGNPSGLPGADGSWYFEAGIAPGFSLGSVAITLPVTGGFADSKFYAGDHFGYVSGGITAAVPLTFIPKGYGTWTVTVGGLYYYLGDKVAAVNRGDHNKGVASVGIGCAF
jgi:hypothetical protein